MTTERDLIQRLADALEASERLLINEGLWDGDDTDPFHGLATEARAWLASTPEPAEGPTDEAVDAAARVIYESIRFERIDSTPAWAERGNSHAQDEARRCARAVLSRYGHQPPQPIPLSERKPEPKDCDAEGQCWQWDPRSDAWVLYTSVGLSLRADVAPCWLPAHALPLPSGEVEHG